MGENNIFCDFLENPTYLSVSLGNSKEKLLKNTAKPTILKIIFDFAFFYEVKLKFNFQNFKLKRDENLAKKLSI